MNYDTYLLKSSNSLLSLFLPEFQKGFYIPSNDGKTLYSFLTEDCGITDEYISNKIKTILIDGNPVDDIFNTKIKEGGVCALSGAMPGIVGAMMRMGSPYAAMRESITAKQDNSPESGKKILLELKLFNVILSDMGAVFLKRGILLEKKRLIEFFIRQGDELLLSCRDITFNGLHLEKENIISNAGEVINGLVLIKVEMENENKS